MPRRGRLRAVQVRDERLTDFVRRMNQTDAADHRGLLAEVHGLPADVDVGVTESAQHLRYG
jgi:hypothetical protein